MKIESSLNPNCSEAVFRFHTVDPVQIHDVLQAIADEISANNDFWGKQTVPQFKTAQEYDTQYTGQPSYSSKYPDDLSDEEREKLSYPKGNLLKACAGLGDNGAVVTVEKDSFVLNIGNNDIEANKTGFVEKIKKLKIKVDQAEDQTPAGKELTARARDCTCGCTWEF